MKRGFSAVVLLCLASSLSLAGPQLRWTPADTTLAVGAQTTLAVMLDEPLAVRTVELYVSYDSDVVATVSGGPGGLFAGYNLFAGFAEVEPASPGQWHGYCVVLGAADWAVGPGELFHWTVRGDRAGSASLSAVSVRLLPPGGGEYTATTLPVTTIHVGSTSAVSSGPIPQPALSIYPNPFNPLANLVFSGAGEQVSHLDVYDLRGRRVVTLWQDALPNGTVIPWSGRDGAGHEVPSGAYTFRLTLVDGRAISTRGTLLR